MVPHTNYYHSHNLSVPKTPPYPHEDVSGAHLSSSRFPINHPIPDSVYPTELQVGTGPCFAESHISPGYESDTESIAMPSPTVPSRRIILASRRTSGGRSDETVWEGLDELPISPRRRQSFDGPSLFGRSRKAGVTILDGIAASQEEVEGRSSDVERGPAISSHLHPYVRNFIIKPDGVTYSFTSPFR